MLNGPKEQLLAGDPIKKSRFAVASFRNSRIDRGSGNMNEIIAAPTKDGSLLKKEVQIAAKFRLAQVERLGKRKQQRSFGRQFLV
jgi:hypothetical protein